MKKKILIVTSTLPRFTGDPEPRFVLDLAQGLSDEFEVTILAPADPAAAMEEKIGRIRILRYRYAPLRKLELLAYPGAILPRLKKNICYWPLVPMIFAGLYRALRNLITEQNYDCVHCHWFLPQGAVQAFGFSGPTSPPFVVTSHGSDLHSLHGTIVNLIYRHVIKKAARITVVSTALQKEIMRRIPEHRGAVVPLTPMGVDCKKFNPEKRIPDYFSRYDIKGPVILFVGRLVKIKGVHILLQAMKTLKYQNLSYHLAIVGDGPEKSSLKAQCDTLNLTSQVHFIDSCNHERLPVLFASADLLCAPSIMDGLPTVLLEACASGLPCIATPVGGIKNFIKNSENGILVTPNDSTGLSEAIRSLISNQTLRQKISESARQSAKEYDWSVVAEKFSSVFRSVISENKKARG